VTKCFNEDRHYDWFARVHLAGDRMPGFDGADYSIDQALAATVPLNGPRTFQEMSTDTFVLMDKLDESVEFMGRSLMGISLECARCHDHKFDPISQHDYYGLLGFFQSSSFGPVPANAKTHAGAEAAVARQRELLRQQARLSGLIRKASIKLNVGGGGRTRKWEAARQAVLAPKEKRLLEIELAILTAELEEAERLRMKKLVDDLEETLKVTTGGVERIQTATLLRRLNQRAGLLHSRSQIGTRPDQASDGCRPDRTRTGDPEAGSVLDGRDGTVSRATTLRWICKVGS
jgi:hypothetical protein